MSKPILIAVGLMLTVVVYSQLTPQQTNITMANTGGGNESGGVDLPDLPPPSTIDQFLKLIRGSSTQSSATRNS